MSNLDTLAELARETQGHVTIHCSYGPDATRHPDADWTAQLIYTAGEPPAPQAWFGVGASLGLACQHVLDQIQRAVDEAGYADPPEATP